MNKSDDLARIRAGIDTIDNQMLALIGNRLQLARSLRALKPAQRAAWAPAREHALLQRLLDQKPENLPAETLVFMWSALITASLMSQGPFVIFSANAEMKALAETAFPGAPMALLDMGRWQEQISQTPGAIAVLPFPGPDATWWCDLANTETPLYVQTCLPKWPPSGPMAACVSADRPNWNQGHVCWAIGTSKTAGTPVVTQADELVLLQAARPFDQEADLPDDAMQLIPVGGFPPPLASGK